MAGQVPGLTIPLKMDLAEALKSIDRLAEQLDRLGEVGAGGMKKSRKEAEGFGGALRGIATHQGWQIAKDLGDGFSRAFKESYDYVKKLGEEFVKTQQTMQQIAALMGKDNSDKFTADQARQAAGAKLTTPEWVRFQEQFQSYGGAYLEGDQRKIGENDALKYQQQIAEFAKARGIDPMQAAQLAGGILQFAPKEITAEEGAAQFGRVFKTLERAPTPVNQLLPQLTRVMAQGASPEDAAQLLTLASEFMPNEEGTAVENTLKALRNAKLEGRGDELGLKDGQTPLEMVKAATAAIDARVKAGENQDEILKEYAPDLREFRGMTGFLNRGQRAGGYDRVQGYIDQTPGDFVDTALKAWEKSDAGRRAGLTADQSLAEVERGQDLAGLAEARMRARAELTREGRFEQSTIGDSLRNGLSVVPFIGSQYGGKEQQAIELRAYQNALKASGRTDIDENYGAALPASLLASETQKILARIADATEKSASPAPRPLAAPPPQVPRAPGS